MIFECFGIGLEMELRILHHVQYTHVRIINVFVKYLFEYE